MVLFTLLYKYAYIPFLMVWLLWILDRYALSQPMKGDFIELIIINYYTVIIINQNIILPIIYYLRYLHSIFPTKYTCYTMQHVHKTYSLKLLGIVSSKIALQEKHGSRVLLENNCIFKGIQYCKLYSGFKNPMYISHVKLPDKKYGLIIKSS